MPTTLKTAQTKSFADSAQEEVAQRVRQIIGDIRARGDAAVARVLADLRPLVARPSFRLDAERGRSDHRHPAAAGDRRHRVRAGAGAPVRPGAARLADRRRDRDAARACASATGTSRCGSAGAYVPGGKYPLTASAHMTIVTAKVAGVPRVVACTPPIRGEIPAATVAAMHLAGADEIWILGGVQAVAAMALGTETMDRVDLIAGPGQRVRGRGQAPALRRGGHRPVRRPDRDPGHRRRRRRPVRGRRRPAVPGRARPGVAGRPGHHQRPRSARRRWRTSSRSCPAMPTRDYAGPAWRDFGQVIVVDDLDEAFAVADAFAAEHVQVLTDEPAPGARQDARLRRAVPRREHLRLLRRQGDRHQPRAADARRRPLHRRPVGGEVPARPSPTRRSPTTAVQRRARSRLRPRGPGRAVRGPRPLRRRPRPGSSRATSTTGSTRHSRPTGGGRPALMTDSALMPDRRRRRLDTSGPLAGRTALVTGGGHRSRARRSPGPCTAPAPRWSSPAAGPSRWGPSADELDRVTARACATWPIPPSVDALAAALADREISILINNAGRRRSGGSAGRDRRRRVGRGVRHQRARRLPDLQGVPAGHGRRAAPAT